MFSSTNLAHRHRHSALAALIGLCSLLVASTSMAAGISPKSVLDTPAANPATGSGTQQILSVAELKEQKAALVKALKAERLALKKLNRQQLIRLATTGERAAQLVLAEDYATEAHIESITIISANDALSDAAYWYSLAARRGVPGSPAIDGILPVFPLRAIRAAN